MDIKSKVTQEKSLEIEIKKVIYWYKKRKLFIDVSLYLIMFGSGVIIFANVIQSEYSKIIELALIFLLGIVLKITLPKPLIILRKYKVNNFFKRFNTPIDKIYRIDKNSISIESIHFDKTHNKTILISRIKHIMYDDDLSGLFISETAIANNILFIDLKNLDNLAKKNVIKMLIDSLASKKAILELENSIEKSS
jgi:hypothetical protein